MNGNVMNEYELNERGTLLNRILCPEKIAEVIYVCES